MSEKSLPGSGPYQTPEGLWVMPEGARPPLEAAGVSPQATGGPDDFGYTWDDSVAFNWVDARGGTNTGLEGDDRFTDAIDIGFDFKFYENTYSQLYITTNGLVTFGAGAYHWSNQSIPNPASPNNFIAPFWDDLCVNYGGYNTGRVYYLRGGSAPNRYFVVEWYEISRRGNNDLLTFEVILYENGNIMTQYLNLPGYLGSVTVGIEDDAGVTGLQYLYNAQGLSNNKAVRFYRPGPTARVKVWSLYQGRFTRAGAAETFKVPIRNTGDLGPDTYDLSVLSTWPVTLFAADGVTPLTDTDSDGTVDTGPLAQGATVTVTVKVQTPPPANVGDDNSAAITVRSSLNTSKSKTATLQTAIPAPFAQVYRDDADGAMSLYLVQPVVQAVKKATSDRYYGYDMAVAEMPDSFAYFWDRGRCLDGSCNVYGDEIEYTLLDRYGQTVRGVSKLTNHSGATMNTYDYDPAVAVAPNGRLGVVWYRYLYNSNTEQSNYNIWFALLDAAGNVVVPPTNLTNNNTWGTWNDYNVPRFYSPRIAATGDNRFVLAWERYEMESGGWLEDIYYAVRDTHGSAIKGATKFTNGVAGSRYYYDPTLAALSSNRALLAYSGPNGVSYAVLNSAGNTVKPETSVGESGYGPDAVQLSDGNIVVAWSRWAVNKYVMQFVVLNGTTYNVTAGPITLNNPAALTGNYNVSVAADSAGHAILTWMDSDSAYRCNLYYALVDGNGTVLTPPMIFRTAGPSDWGSPPYIETSYEGYGNTSYSWTPPSGVDGAVAFSASLFGGAPGGNVAVGVRYANHGATMAAGVVLTATLDSNLTYVRDTSGVVSTVSGNDVVWSLPDLGLLDSQDFALYVQVPPAAAYGARYPITLTLTSVGPEANTADNTARAEVMAARQVFLPLVFRDR
ncbi:MAG TPA: hypothetical protein PKH92_08935 [Anaerolineaceae bacterium]|nr:hypothetical protein [Anaerolineaceae bacterium]